MAREQVVGIYSISTPDGVYIGSSIDVYARWTKHRSDLKLGTHRCKPLQRSINGGSTPVFKIVERCLNAELEEKEAVYINDPFVNIFNLSKKTGVGMRDPDVARRNVESRGDSQHGAKSSSAKLDEEGYIMILGMLFMRKKYDKIEVALSHQISQSSIRRISRGESHRWLRELNEEEYDAMVKYYTDVTLKRDKIPKITGYEIVHKGGEKFTGTALEISEKLGISSGIAAKLIRKQLIFVKGWKRL